MSEKAERPCGIPNQKYGLHNTLGVDYLFRRKFIVALDLKSYMMEGLVYTRGTHVRRVYMTKVFCEMLQLIIQRCMHTGQCFSSPNAESFQIFIRPMPEIERERIMKNKKIYQNVDLLETDFKIYHFVYYNASFPKGKRYKDFRIRREQYQELVELANKGRAYGNTKQRFYMSDLMPDLKAKFPAMPEKFLREIVKEACGMMTYYLKAGKDMRIRVNQHNHSYKFYTNIRYSTIKRNAKPEPVS